MELFTELDLSENVVRFVSLCVARLMCDKKALETVKFGDKHKDKQPFPEELQQGRTRMCTLNNYSLFVPSFTTYTNCKYRTNSMEHFRLQEEVRAPRNLQNLCRCENFYILGLEECKLDSVNKIEQT